MCGNLIFALWREKTKNDNNCTKGLKHKCMAGFTLGIDLLIIYLPKVTRSCNRCFSPLLSFLSFSYHSLLTNSILNHGGYLRKSVMETLYVIYLEFKQCLKVGKTKNGNSFPEGLNHKRMARFTLGNDLFIICLPKVTSRYFSLLCFFHFYLAITN